MIDRFRTGVGRLHENAAVKSGAKRYEEKQAKEVVLDDLFKAKSTAMHHIRSDGIYQLPVVLLRPVHFLVVDTAIYFWKTEGSRDVTMSHLNYYGLEKIPKILPC